MIEQLSFILSWPVLICIDYNIEQTIEEQRYGISPSDGFRCDDDKFKW